MLADDFGQSLVKGQIMNNYLMYNRCTIGLTLGVVAYCLSRASQGGSK